MLRTVAPILAGVGVLAVLAGVLWAVSAYLTDRQRDDDPDFEVGIGAEQFDAGDHTGLLARIERDGAPILFPDLLVGGDLYIYVNHLGPGPQEGWVAFEAKPEGADVTCTLRWDRGTARFVDPCGAGTYPPDGAGLRQFDTEITPDADLVIRLKPEAAPDPVDTTPRSTVDIVGG